MEGKMGDRTRSQTISTRLQQIAEQAKRERELVFTRLAHHMDVDMLKEAHRRLRKDAAPGVDGVTGQEYATDLDENLQTLHERMRSGRYEAPPVKRKWLDKDDGKKRPIGMTAFEDKIPRKAVSMILNAVFEAEFYDFSHAYRAGHSQHQALAELREQCRRLNINWIVDGDVSGCFDNLSHKPIRQFVKKRVNDGTIIRFIGKWLNAGVLDGQALTHPTEGTPQGAVISPTLSNIYLNYVLDDWFVKAVKPRMKGRCFLIRFADDFIVGFEYEKDACRFMAVLPKRFARYGLTINPEKTKLIKFGRPTEDGLEGSASGNGTFDFLGFTHYWTRSRKGNWVIKRQTARKRLRRAMKANWQWCRHNRHEPVKEQYGMLCRKLRGYYQYYGVRGNYKAMEAVYEHVEKAWRYWLSRRDRQGTVDWATFEATYRVQYPLPKPRIIHAA